MSPIGGAKAITGVRQPPVSWRRGVSYGFLGGVALIAMELLLLPVGLSASELLQIAIYLLPQWCATGIGIACLAIAAERRFNTALLALALVLFAVAMSGVVFGVSRLARDLDLMAFVGGAPPWPTFFYNLWVILFFGGLFMVVCVLNIRAERTRTSLGKAEIERSRTEILLGEAQLRALQGHVDPVFLLRVLADVEQRYAHRPADADRLLDRLVVFLRNAMPGVRSGHSTLEGEIALATAYAHLWADLEPRRESWRIRIAEPLPELPFPPLLLLPILDCLAATTPVAPRGDIAVTSVGNGVTLALDGPAAATGDWFPSELAYRLRVGLRTELDDAWTLTINDTAMPGLPALTLTVTARAR